MHRTSRYEYFLFLAPLVVVVVVVVVVTDFFAVVYTHQPTFNNLCAVATFLC